MEMLENLITILNDSNLISIYFEDMILYVLDLFVIGLVGIFFLVVPLVFKNFMKRLL